MARMVGPDGGVYDIPDDQVPSAIADKMVPEGFQQQRPATAVGRAENLGTGERARASIRDWASGIGITDPGNRSDPQFTGIPLTVPAAPTVGGRIKEGLGTFNPLNIADPELLSDPVVGGPKTLLNILTAVATGKAMPKGAKVTPGTASLIESGATGKLANAVRLPAGAGITETQLGQALESTRSYATAARKGTSASSKIAIPSNAEELVNTLRDAAKASKSPAHVQTLTKLADLGERRIGEVAGAPQGANAALGQIGMFSPKVGLLRKAAGIIWPTEEQVMNRMVRGAMKLTGPRVPRGWHQYSRPAVGSLAGSVVGDMEAGDYVRGKGARIGSAR